MQKIEFVNSIKIIYSELLTEKLIQEVEKSLKMTTPHFNGQSLTSIIVESKSNYDKINSNANISRILNLMSADKIYQPSHISQIINILLSKQNPQQTFYNQSVLDFYNLHNTITILSKATEEIFFENKEITPYDKYENGLILFNVLNNADGISIRDYSKIFTQFIELIDAINEVYFSKKEMIDAEIVILDSGSDTILGIKTAAETAKALFDIFKEVWDFIVNKKHYQNKITNQSVYENLEIMKKIKESESQNILTSEESKALIHTIKTRTAQLLDLNVLPKTLTEKEIAVSNMDVLLEYREVKKLKE